MKFQVSRLTLPFPRLTPFKPRSRNRGQLILARRRIFILPTRQGLLFAGMLLLMLIGSINYHLNLGFALVFLLGAMGIVSILHTYRTLAGLRISAGKSAPTFAGGMATFRVNLDNPAATPRLNVAISHPDSPTVYCHIPPGQTYVAAVQVPASQRGWLRARRLTLHSRHPLGLFQAWSSVELDMQCLVYPRPDRSHVPLPFAPLLRGEGRDAGQGSDDFAGLRDYRPGDSPRHIAWKAAAQERGTFTKQFSGCAPGEVWLDWEALPGLDTEARLSRLTRWVVECDALGIPYGLRLPALERAPALGPDHRHACLKALALFCLGDTTAPPAARACPSMEPRLTLRQTHGLLLALALAVAPHVPRLPLWLSAFVVGVGLWRWYLALSGSPLPPRPLLYALTAVGVAGTALHFGTLVGRSGGVALLIVLVALKLLESRTKRDAALLVFLGYALVITEFLYDQSIPVAAYSVLPVAALTTALVGLAHASDAQELRAHLKIAVTLLLQSLPIAVMLFVFFPRIANPLWSVPQETATGVSGLSETLSPGDLSRLSLSDAVAFRVDFRGEAPPPSRMYWRGPVLWHFDGRTWSTPLSLKQRQTTLEPLDQGITYTVTLEPHHQRWLFALELPVTLPEKSILTWDHQLLATTPVRARLRYEVKSHLRYRAHRDASPWEIAAALQLPPTGNPRARALAEQWRQALADPRAVIQRALEYFRSEGFFYTLQPPLLSEEAIDDFLFNTRRGFCEHYASSFAFLMRAAGIPARVVTGYQGGELNPIGNYLIVRQADAHAWAEVWLADTGWMRVDPTAAVSPARIERGIASAAPAGEPLPLLMRAGDGWLRQMRLAWDAAANAWNLWVLGYTEQRQRDLLSRIGFNAPSWQSMAVALVFSTAVLIGALALAMWWRRPERRPDPVQRLYRRFCQRLARRGLPRRREEGPHDYAARVAAARPELAPQVESISRLYIALRYGDERDPRSLKRLRELVARFRA